MGLAGHFGSGTVADADLAAGLHGVVVKDDESDARVWKEYLENVMKKRGGPWSGLYKECRKLL
jgi:hypothetical protein